MEQLKDSSMNISTIPFELLATFVPFKKYVQSKMNE